MFQPIKNLFSKWTRKQPPASAPASSASAPPPPKLAPPAKESKPAAPSKSAPPKAAPPRAAAPAAPVAAAAPAPVAAPEAPSGVPEETFALPLRVVLSRLPASLAASVKSTGGGDLQLPLRKVLSQLPQGVVKISFGELRQGAPVGTFLEVASQDSTMIELPLPEIVSRINPALISRRQDQKTIEVPPEVGNVFGPRGETIVPPIQAATPAPAPLIPAPAAAPRPPAPVPSPSSTALPKPPAPSPSISTPSLPKPPANPSSPAFSPSAAPKVPTVPNIPKPPAPAPNLPKPPSASPISMPKLPTSSPVVPKSEVVTPIAPIGAAVSPVATHSTQFFLEKEAATSSGTLSVPLSSLSAGWPEPVKAEIAQHNLKESSAELPMANVEVGLKTGKIVFTWREVAGWLHPKPFTTSAAGDTLIELPLKVIAPAFIAQHKPAKTQKKVAVGENIPDIFSGGAPVAKPAAAAAPMPAPVPAPVAAPAAPAPALPKMPMAPAPVAAAESAKLPSNLGEVFGEADKKDWSPRDIVTKAGLVKGLSGAVISTHDGLMVAGELPAPMKAETVAAFLPQIFSRMNGFGKELQVGGEVSTMTVTFDKVPWQVSKLGKVYFAAVGRPGETLPVPQLALICGELAKQNK